MNPRPRSPAPRGFTAVSALRLGLIALLALFGLSACQTAPAPRPYSTLGWEDHRLLNSSRPYDKLLVEIDAVAGTEPSAAELADLRAFLEQVTSKPGGVTVRLDDLIAPADAKGRGANSLALQYLDGPSDDRTAFLYILCYRGRFTPFSSSADNPHFTLFPYPSAIFVNRSYALGSFSWFDRTRRALLRHEVGHALGLARTASHSQAGHCTDPTCLMRPDFAFRFSRFLTFRQPYEQLELCAACRRDLETYRLADAPPGARFWRGYFVRSGEGYHLVTLPGMVYVHLGEIADLDADRLAALRREVVGEGLARDDCRYELHGNLFESADGLRHFVARETEEAGLRNLAEKTLANCLAQAEALRDTDPAQARAFAAAALPAATPKFPELHRKLQALHDSLPPPASSPPPAEAVSK